MHFKEYQDFVKQTAIYPRRHALTYPLIGLGGEAGEVLNKYQKLMRDKDLELDEKDRESIALELGDVLWYTTAIAIDLGYDLDTIAEMNHTKLQSRMNRGKVGGSGDNR